MTRRTHLLFALLLGCADPAPAPDAPASAPPATGAPGPADGGPANAEAGAQAGTEGGAIASPPPSRDRPEGASALRPGGSLAFSARKNETADVRGSFGGLQGWLHVPDGRLADATGRLLVDWSTVATGDAARDMNLRIAFFAAVAPGPRGDVWLQGLASETATLAPGGVAPATARLVASAGLAEVPLEIAVTVTRSTDGAAYTLASETGAISIGGLGMDERKAALIALCQHASIGDAVGLSGSLTFGP